MKYAIRRSIVGIVSIPFVAGAYVFLNLYLLLLGADPIYSVEDAFYNGVQIGVVVALIFAFYPQFSKFVNKLI